MTLAHLSDSETITFTVAGVIVTIVLLIFVAVLVRRERVAPKWWRFRVGIFVERIYDPPESNDEPKEVT